ncbi:FecR family protein [Pseudoalteromonas denitrificans]|uniref:FecR family protein n=1 Tax=Pseudoalteromonas denitrificans DSM 6059 TaxID=1123010 RepID=A0A1I1QAK5_9GAMM|nr:FecR domain-containing protein [Pseudoalteromonas denitrificans]SFD18982.1 FecR family protein [Pseudoalteromonas denitrificans DSM 6059]
MTNVTKFNRKQIIQEQASLWISRMDRGLSLEEKNEFSVWINQSEYHKDTLYQLAKLWDDLTVLNELSDLFPLESKTKSTQNKFIPIAIAASFIAIMFTSSAYFLDGSLFPILSNTQKTAQIKQYQTKIGEQISFSMPDGTNVRLNTNSTIKVAYTAKHRQISLLKGEARFDVAKDKTRPFTVSTDKKSFTALGTIFNVQNTKNNELELLVTEGKVLISDTDSILKTTTLNDIVASFTNLSHDNLPGTVVNSGEKSVVKNNMQLITDKISLDQIQRELAWQQGMLIFDGEPLNKALLEVARYSNTQFEINDTNLSHLKISGYFKAGDIEGLLESLNENFNIIYQKSPNNIIRLTKV